MASGYGYPLPPALQDCVIDNIRIGNQIGGGANGRILEAKWEGIVVAVKEIQPFFMTEVSDSEFQWFKTSFLRECEHSSRLRHPNIVRFFGIYHPPGARVPSLVMERLHCSLTSLLEENPVVPIGTKISIIKDVALGLRYLHTRNPPIIHRDLSSNNVLLSKGMEGKIGDLGTARLVDPRRQSKMTKAPGTVDFMPPEALENVINIHYSEELDVFSFGCVMLHTLSHQWPTPSQAVIINPETGLAIGGRTEVERRSRYFERIDRSRSEMLIPLIESCLSNLPKNRPSIVRVCDQLEGHLVDGKSASTNELTVSALQQEIQQKDAEIQRIGIEAQRRIEEIQQKDVEIQRKDREVQWKNAEIQRKITELQRKDSEIHWRDRDIQWRNSEIQTKNFQLQRKDIEIQNLIAGIRDKDVMLETMRYDLSRLQITNPYGEVQKKNDEIQRKDTEILRKNAELQEKIAKINWLTTELNDKDVKLKTVKQINKSSSDFWKSFDLTWKNCTDLLHKCWVISVVELDGKVYATILHEYGGGGYIVPHVYDISKDQWSRLPALPHYFFSLVTVPVKKQLLAIGGMVNKEGIDKVSNEVFLWDEVNRKWITLYPNMPTARFRCSSISHGSAVIVAGGVTCGDPFTMTRAVEVLHIKDNNSWFSKSQWSVVEQLPHIVREVIPLIVNDKLYLAQGYDDSGDARTCSLVAAPLSELLKSSNKNTESSKIWRKLPDMPYSSFSINHYQGRLITFGGVHKVERPDKDRPVWESVPLIHIYNPDTMTWDCVGEIPYGYLLGRSVHIRDDKLLLIGGTHGEHNLARNDNMMTDCSILIFSPR